MKGQHAMKNLCIMLVVFAPTFAQAATCSELATLALPNATIDLAENVPAGDFSFNVNRAGTSPQNHPNLPAFCRVAATLKPSADSDIKIEVWLPEEWNGKLFAVGNGRWAGSISFGAMADGLRQGYAATSTDTGHAADSMDGSWSFDQPEKVIDFGWRSLDEMTVKAKDIIEAFYGEGPRFSYWRGCSTGGRQGLMLATRFPDHYDGIIAGTPSNPRANRNGWQLWATSMTRSGTLTTKELEFVHHAAVEACDMNDGLKDGLIDDPTKCEFDPQTLLCQAGQSENCLSPEQVNSVKVMYSPSRFSNGEIYHPGLEPGSELGWEDFVSPEPLLQAAKNYRYLAHNNPDWDWRTFEADTDVPLAIESDGGTIDVTTTDYSGFVASGGKMIIYHGWSDYSVAPQRTVDYFRKVLETTPDANEAMRLFMVPMMGHCGGGDGPNEFDMVSALDAWVDGDEAPTRVIASRNENGQTVRTRPLCVYPQVARYQGAGSIDDAANFICVAP
jgi:feruloyl esterase